MFFQNQREGINEVTLASAHLLTNLKHKGILFNLYSSFFARFQIFLAFEKKKKENETHTTY